MDFLFVAVLRTLTAQLHPVSRKWIQFLHWSVRGLKIEMGPSSGTRCGIKLALKLAPKGTRYRILLQGFVQTVVSGHRWPQTKSGEYYCALCTLTNKYSLHEIVT